MDGNPVVDPAPMVRTARPGPGRSTRESVIALHRWTEALLSVRVTRDPAYRFTPGHYARLGLPAPGVETVFRPLSIASAPAEPSLEFLCTLVPGGVYSSRLATLRVGDPVEIERASYGFLTLEALAAGQDLWLLASGTGLAPYLSMLRDPDAWSRYEQIVVVHSVRRAADLACAAELRAYERRPPFTSPARLRYEPVVTREPGAARFAARIPALLADGRLPAAVGTPLDSLRSRVMVCGHPDLTRDMRTLLGERGFRTARRGAPGQMAFEKYW